VAQHPSGKRSIDGGPSIQGAAPEQAAGRGAIAKSPRFSGCHALGSPNARGTLEGPIMQHPSGCGAPIRTPLIIESFGDLAQTATLALAVGDHFASVDLATLALTLVDDAPLVCLADAWVASGLPYDLFDVAIDFVADDGYRPSRADERWIDGHLLAHAFLHAGRRDLVWRGGVSLPCAWNVRAVAMVIAELRA
jgi:hypothetical protein